MKRNIRLLTISIFILLGFIVPVKAQIVKTTSLIKVSDIIDVEIRNAWTNKTWHMSSPALIKFKNYLNKSKATIDGPLLKPGHLYMNITLNKGLRFLYSTYMYDNTIYFENVTWADESIKDKKSFMVTFPKKTNWDNFK